MTIAIDGVEALQHAVRERGRRLVPVAGATKPALSSPTSEGLGLDVSRLRGVVDYVPAELTVTAMAGMPIADLDATLAEHGQYMPFDPPLAAAGATLGGVVAAGTSGPGAFRHGGIRDFIIGVRFVDGTGQLVAGGARVVKNAAGFDLPKLMVGSRGRLGTLVEVSLKVFPRAQGTVTLVIDVGSMTAALDALTRLARGPVELDALDLEPPGRLLVRLGGHAQALQARAQRVAAGVDGAVEMLEGEHDEQLWAAAAAFAWVPPGHALVRVAVTVRTVPALEERLATNGARARYSNGANVAWVAWPSERPLHHLDQGLRSLGLAGMPLTGAADRTLLGAVPGGAFAERIRRALDPHHRFLED
jgi:glycolate dehydrogenase FAD-binding subunit